ncbi:MAG: hypothetical protein Q9219_000962 [cf. Caloplaca sp. 3 TL-2023]
MLDTLTTLLPSVPPATYDVELIRPYLSIHHPPRPSANAPIILYLPPGLPSNNGHICEPPNPLASLAISAHATIIHVTYRLSPTKPYPTPIHDLLAAYDWVLNHLIPRPGNDQNPPTPPPIGVCGQLKGGALAATLALTECHDGSKGKPGVRAAALGNPIVDWSPPFPVEMGKKSPPPSSPPSSTRETTKYEDDNSNDKLTRALNSLRKTSFTNPEQRYDPFASPLLFFRTPAFELPPAPYYTYGLLPPSPPDEQQQQQQQQRRQSEESTENPDFVPKKRSHRKYPPLDSDLRLPRTRIMIGKESPVREQGVEFAQLMQRSVDLYERGDGGYSGASREAQRRVELVEVEGEGLWGEREVRDIGVWFGEVLRLKG